MLWLAIFFLSFFFFFFFFFLLKFHLGKNVLAITCLAKKLLDRHIIIIILVIFKVRTEFCCCMLIVAIGFDSLHGYNIISTCHYIAI